jgi:hypothetical protein
LLEEEKRRQEIQFAQRTGAIIVHSREGGATVIRIQFVEAINGNPGEISELNAPSAGLPDKTRAPTND